MFQGIWCRLSVVFFPARRLAQVSVVRWLSLFLSVCTNLCMPMLGVAGPMWGMFCCSPLEFFFLNAVFSLNLKLIISARLAGQWAPPVSITQYRDYRCAPVGHLNSGPPFLQQALPTLSQLPSLSLLSEVLIATSKTEAFTLFCFWGRQQYFSYSKTLINLSLQIPESSQDSSRNLQRSKLFL